MAQFDLLLYQNVHATGIEFTERFINIAKGGILSADTSGVPTVLAGGTNGYMLVRDDATATGLKWQAISAGHTQGTDTGTTSDVFHIDSDGFDIILKPVSASKMNLSRASGADLADLEVRNLTAIAIALSTGTISGVPSTSNDIVNKAYADSLIAANNAMVYKGTIGVGGTHEIAAFNSLGTYNVGWTYRVITAGTIKGVVCEVGDLITAIVSRSGSGNVNADWTVVQTNTDGVVIGPASSVDNYIALFNGATGKLLKQSTSAIGTMAYEAAANYVAKSTLTAQTVLAAVSSGTPVAITVNEQTLVGRKTGGNVTALTAAEIRTILNVADGANAYTHPSEGGGSQGNMTGATVLQSITVNSNGHVTATSTRTLNAANVGALAGWVTAPASKTASGTAGQIAKDDNYLYVCTAANTWKRSMLATNW